MFAIPISRAVRVIPVSCVVIDPVSVLSFVKMEDLDLPEIKRRKIQDKKVEDKREFKDLFESDSDDEDTGLKMKGKRSCFIM